MHAHIQPDLFNHQTECLNSTITELSIADRCKIIMACGTGKTRIGSELALLLASRSIVVYLPSLALVRQTLPEWLKAPFSRGLDFMCVCSDETVATFSDDAQVTIDDLVEDLGIERSRVTTDSTIIHEYLARPCETVRVVFCTYQSCDTLRNGLPENFVFGLGIFDEAHKTAGRNVAFSAPLNDSHTPINKRVFMTATPKHFDIRKRDKEGDARVSYSMDDEASYGRTAYNLPIRKAIELGVIAGYQVLVSVIGDKTIAHTLRSKTMGDAQHEAIAHAIAIKNAMTEYGLMKAVTFHDTVDNAAFFAEHELIKQELGIPTFHVSGKLKSRERSTIMDNFASAERGLVTNARCLTEGIDVPAIDLVAFLHPKKSQIDIIQAIGRALRRPLGSEKTTGYILLPLYVSDAENGGLEEALHEYGYDTIFQVIQALREQDEVVEAALTQFKIDRVRNIGDAKFTLDFITTSWAGNQVDVLRDVITTRIVDTLVESWYTKYALLKKVYEDTGDANVEKNFCMSGVRLGWWLSYQRSCFVENNLTKQRYSLLSSIGVLFDDRIEIKWKQHFSILEKMYEETGNANVSNTFEIHGLKLGQYLALQRKAYRKGKLPQSRVDLLKSIGVSLDISNDNWEHNFSLLQDYLLVYKHSDVPQDCVYKGSKLGTWVTTQRSAYSFNQLTTERVVKLESIGFKWSLKASLWDEHFNDLNKIYTDTGSSNIPISTVINDVKLGSWVSVQRKRYKLNKLNDLQIKKLESIEFRWVY